MAEQNLANHRHQPWPTLVVTALWLIAVVASAGAHYWGWSSQGIALAGLEGAVLVLIVITRSYITRLQDRIIMLEMKVRCAEVLPAGQDAALGKLGPKQITALRFASDDELGSLLDRTVRENLKPAEIKAAVKTWRPDLHRT